MQPVFAKLEMPPEASIRAFVKNAPRQSFLWHHHPEYEITLSIQGSGQRFIGDDVGEYAQGDLVLLGPHLPHTWRSVPRPRIKRHRSIVVQFDESFLGTALTVCPEMKAIRELLERASRGIEFFGRRRTQAARLLRNLLRFRGVNQLAAVLKLLDLLASCREYRLLASADHASLPDLACAERLREILDVIRRDFKEPLQQAEMAKMAGLSPGAYSRFFHRATGMTYVDYVNGLRVGHACRLLLETELPVTQVCFDSGFTSLSNFNRAFRRRRGMTPSEFRQQFVEK